MKKKGFKFWLFIVVVCIGLLFVNVIADPGTNEDPLISKSYIENVLIPRIEKLIDSRVSGGVGNTGASSSFTVVEARAGQEIICGAGSELILRMGSATVIATAKGGLADTTSGYDLANGTAMPSNHLLVVPVADGRGVKAQTNVIVLVKGSYSIK